MDNFIPMSSKEDLNPFAPIRKEPLESRDGTVSSRYGIQIEDNKSDSGWKEVGDVSKSYFLISNAEMREVANDITSAANMDFQLDKTFFNGKVFLESWTTADISSEVAHAKAGDALIAGLMFQNSYDGSRRAAMYGFIKRLVCSNGMIANFLFKNWRFKHTMQSEYWTEEVQKATALLEHFPERLDKFAELCSQLTVQKMKIEDLSQIRQNGLNKLPGSSWGKIVDKFLQERETNAGKYTHYDLLNACTSHFWHKKQTVSDFDWNAYCVNALVGQKYRTKSYIENMTNGEKPIDISTVPVTIPEA